MKSNMKWMGVALAAVTLVTISASLFPRSATGDEKKVKASALSYHDDWRKLFEDHITWTRVVILGVLKDLPRDRHLYDPAAAKLRGYGSRP